MSAGEADPTKALASREIVSSRVVGAPRERVFEAFADPNHLVHWWGPKGFTNTFHEFDLRPGGTWRFAMRGPNGVDYQNESVFVEVMPPERIVFDHVSGPQFRMTIELAEHDGRTKITWRMRFASVAEREKVSKFAVDANEQNLDRLEAQLAKMV